MLPWLTFDDFLLPKVNWLPKSENIKEALAALSLTAKGAVFVENNPVECDKVHANERLGIRVIGAAPFVTRRLLLWAPIPSVAGWAQKCNKDIISARRSLYENERRPAAAPTS